MKLLNNSFSLKVFVASIILASTSAFGANQTSCEHGGACPGQGGNGGNGGGGNGGESAAISVSSATSTAIAASGSVSGALAGASGGEATGGNSAASVQGSGGSAATGAVSNSVTTGNVRSLSLGAASVGSPAADTCVAYLAIGFGLVTTPVQVESCVAMQQALLLNQFGLRDAAISRLCQLKEIQLTGICPKPE